MKNRTVMQHAFSMVPTVKKPRSVFDRSHGYKTSFDSDFLIPFYAKNVLPGDSVTLRQSAFIRILSQVIRPFMDNLWFDTFYFFVPYRLLWTNFVKFMGEQNSPADSISYTVPQITSPNAAAGGVPIGHLYDYFGVPTEPLSLGGGTTGITFNNLIGRGYNKIWMDWFKDENLQNAITLDLGDGPDTWTNYNLLKRGKRHDYFTSALPFLQKGTAVTLPLGTSANVMTSASQLVSGAQNAMTIRSTAGAVPAAVKSLSTDTAGSALWNDTVPGAGATGWYPSNLFADLSTATASTVNAMRQSVALQQFLENDARGGTRYTEIVQQRWGVVSPDARLQRSELLGLHSAPIKVHPVAGTNQDGFVNQALLSGFGTGVDVSQGFTKSFTEHGVIIGLMSVRADLTYSQGLERWLSYRTRYDFFNPEFAHLGEQEIKNKEIFANCPDGTGATQKDGVFGYQERYAEERYSNSMLTGLMRPDAALTLSLWHLSEEFATLPTLGATFIQSSASGPVDRVISSPAEPQFIADVYFKEKWARVMPVFGVPGLAKL